jgi:MoaA/NifB/PqqE/SkfB family radical SAM enzyme
MRDMTRLTRAVRTLMTRRLTLTFDRIPFSYDSLSDARLKNWLLTELSYAFGSTRAWALPTHLQIEPAAGCNLRCPMCYIVTQNIKQGVLEYADFKKIIDEVADVLLFLHFWGWGEPFINSDIHRMIWYARDRGIRIITSTNGHFLESRDSCRKIIESGLDALIVAVDGADCETYERYRQRGEFNTVLKGIDTLCKLKKELRAPAPIVNMRMVVTRQNEDQIDAMRQLAGALGVDLFSLKTLHGHGDEDLCERSLPEELSYRRYEYDDEGQPIRKNNSCRRLWNHPAILHDGRIVPCDYFASEDLTLGNAFDRSPAPFGACWYGEPFQALRGRLVRGDLGGLLCDECPLNYCRPEDNVSHAWVPEPGERTPLESSEATPT